MPCKLIYTPEFQRKYKKLSSDIRSATKKRLFILQENPFSSELRTHKLSGKMNDLWAFSINFHIRVIFEFLERDTIHLLSIGDHSIYRKK